MKSGKGRFVLSDRIHIFSAHILLITHRIMNRKARAGLKLTSLGLVEVLWFAFAGLDPLFLHSQGSWHLSGH